MRIRLLTVLVASLLAFPSHAGQPDPVKFRMLVNLLDYINKDYKLAVQDGAVVNEFEYSEMREFSSNVHEFINGFEAIGGIDSSLHLKADARQLIELIELKASAAEVSYQSSEIRRQLLELGFISLTPSQWPDLKKGASLYITHCTSCHGDQGHGNGQAGLKLSPRPTAFSDPSIMENISPFQAFNTMRLGIPGTSMRAFDELSEEECWDLAFFIISLQHPKGESGSSNLGLEEIAIHSDSELRQLHPQVNIASLRHSVGAPDARIGSIKLARENIEAAAIEYEKGEHEKASQLMLMAYLNGIEPIEPIIKASDNSLFEALETCMMKLRSAGNDELTLSEYAALRQEVMVLLEKSEAILSEDGRSTTMTALLAAGILIREGLEAMFIILAVLGVVGRIGVPRAARWIHAGWISAVAFGIIGWFFTDLLMQWSPQHRELMEGAIAVFAVFVLLYLGYWLHGKSEASRWKEFVETRIRLYMTSNNMIGLSAFSFVVVFRESFESVLFLSSLKVGGGEHAGNGILIGALSAAVFMVVVAALILRWYKRLPVSKVFLYSSIMILSLAFILCGQGVHSLQEGGYVSVHSFPLNLKIGFLGIYPTFESLMAQATTLALITLLWSLSNRSPKAE